MRLVLFFMIIGIAAIADDDTLGRRGRSVSCKVPAHSHPQYCTEEKARSIIDERLSNLTYDNLLPGTLPEVKQHQKPVAYPHCYLRTWGEYAVPGRCRFSGDVAVGFENGYTICARTTVECRTDWILKHIF